ncbi:MAG: hypothetical protein WBG71_03590 [Leeuwenhoekiella sp.]
MLLKRTNIHEKLLLERERCYTKKSILNQVSFLLKHHKTPENNILNRLKAASGATQNPFDLDLLDSHRVFHQDQIKKICIIYRLRFLDTRFFKNDFPNEAIAEIKRLENEHDAKLEGFKIIAPSKMFVLRKTDDPLLFAPIGNGYFYLIHKWGNDLHPLRRVMMWPFKNFENLIFTVLLASIVATLLVPTGMFSHEDSFSQDVMVLFFMFKSIAAVTLYYGFAAGKNFNTAIWKSQFDKAQ